MILTGKQISERWSIIKAALKLSAAPVADTGEGKLNNILKALLDGRAICWMTGNARRPRTVIITTMSIEEVSGTKNMIVYCAHGFEKEKPEQYTDILTGLSNFAKDRKCDNILCYVWDDKIKELLQNYGAECNYTLAVFNLN